MEFRVVRFTNAFDAACHFYGELLGWPATHEWPASPGGGRGRLFGFGDTARIEFIERPDDPAVEDRYPIEAVSGMLVSVQHPDVVALHDHLVASGVAILRPVTDMPWGHRAFAVLDPSGIELVHFQPIAQASSDE